LYECFNQPPLRPEEDLEDVPLEDPLLLDPPKDLLEEELDLGVE
tara:strand:+ start:1320 stop:1451 length:132 start_codon:yes stop_codon:yes gene_type:complete